MEPSAKKGTSGGIPEKANHRGLRTFQNLDTFCPGVFSMLLLTTQEYALCTSAVRQRYKSGTPRRYDSGTTANKRYDSGAKPQRLRQQYDSSALAVAWPKWLLWKKNNNNCDSARLASKAYEIKYDRCGRAHKKSVKEWRKKNAPTPKKRRVTRANVMNIFSTPYLGTKLSYIHHCCVWKSFFFFDCHIMG